MKLRKISFAVILVLIYLSLWLLTGTLGKQQVLREVSAGYAEDTYWTGVKLSTKTPFPFVVGVRAILTNEPYQYNCHTMYYFWLFGTHVSPSSNEDPLSWIWR